MAQRFSFSQYREGQLFVYHYKNVSDNKLVQRAWPDKIDQQWWENWDFQPFNKYNVCGYCPVHNAIYLALAWKLTKGLIKFGIPTWARDEASAEIGKSFDLVKWEYSCLSNNGFIVDQGFIRARSNPYQVSIKDGKFTYLDKHIFKRRNLAGLFALKTYEEFIGIQKPSLIEASSETNYYGIEDNKRAQRLKRSLNSFFRPKLDNILDGKDIFINISIGLDLGYPDSVIIKTKQDITSKLNALVNEFYLLTKQYEVRMSDVYEMSDFTKAICELVNL